MNKRKTLITMLALVCMLVVGIGFAAFAKTLTINGTVHTKVDDSKFVVEFENTEGQPYTSNGTTATVEIADTVLKNAGNSTTVTLKIANNSTDNYNAVVQKPSVNVTSSDITVTTDWGDAAKTIVKDGDTTVTLTITLVKAQLTDGTHTFTVTFAADAEIPA